MKKLAVSLGRVLFVLLLAAGLSVCTLPDQSGSPPPEDAISFDQLLAGLDELQGPATQSPSAPGRSVFSLPGGSLMNSADLSAYLGAIKRDLAAYIYSCTGGAPYLVVPRSVTFDADPSAERYAGESGLIWVPYTWMWWKKFPVISYQHGTQVAWECAPSRFNPNALAILSARDLTGALQNYVECIVGGLMASAGYIVAMPDYAGFGQSDAMHPYVHLSLGNSVEGIVGHALSKLKANGAVYLTGYSEGGYATMAGARALYRAPGITPAIRAIVPCDGPYSLSGSMLTQMLGSEPVKVPSYLLYTASGYYAAEPTMPEDVTTFLKDPWYARIGESGYFNGDHTNAEVGRLVESVVLPKCMLTDYAVSYWLKLPPLPPPPDQDGGPVYELLEKNDAWMGWTPACPLVFVHCPDDDVVPYDNAVRARAAYPGLPPIVDVQAIPFIESVMGTTHIAAYPAAMLAAFEIIREH